MKFTVEQARRYRNLKQEEVANALNLSLGAYLRREKSPDEFRLKEAKAFLKLVQMSSSDVIFFED